MVLAEDKHMRLTSLQQHHFVDKMKVEPSSYHVEIPQGDNELRGVLALFERFPSCF